jgi:hypothetical protein
MKDFKLYVFIASLLLVFYLVAEYKRPKPINWSVTYLKKDKIPFGTYILYNHLHDIFPGDSVSTFREPVYNVLNDHDISKATYIIICKYANLNEYDFGKLTNFIKKGNDVFIASTAFGEYLYKKLNMTTERVYNHDIEDSICFVNSHLDSTKTYKIAKEINEAYFDEIDTANATVLARNAAKQATFVKYTFGKGNLYLSSTPGVFTNYSLLNPLSAEYAAKSLSYLKNKKTILWDEYYNLGRDGEESIMRVFFSNPALKWAYYIALISLVVYVLYQMKRRQRIIPVIEPLSNSTLDFVSVVGQVYYEQRDNSNIAQKKASYFLEHIRNQFNLKTNMLNDEFVEALSQKSAVDTKLVKDLIHQIIIIHSNTHVSDQQLIDLNKNIEQFYLLSR